MDQKKAHNSPINLNSLKLTTILAAFWLLGASLLPAQDSPITLEFQPTYYHLPVSSGSVYTGVLGEEIVFEKLRMYVAHIQLWKDAECVGTFDKKYHLLDLDEPNSLQLTYSPEKPTEFNRLSFQIGSDSLTNAGGVQGGDLDPTKGMYWAWQSGYINFKLEGASDICPSRNHRFQFHLGGFLAPYPTVQQVDLPVSGQRNLKLNIALEPLLDPTTLEETYEIMSPGAKAMEYSAILPSLFSVAK